MVRFTLLVDVFDEAESPKVRVQLKYGSVCFWLVSQSLPKPVVARGGVSLIR